MCNEWSSICDESISTITCKRFLAARNFYQLRNKYLDIRLIFVILSGFYIFSMTSLQCEWEKESLRIHVYHAPHPMFLPVFPDLHYRANENENENALARALSLDQAP